MPTPGPGSYDPKFTAIEPDEHNNLQKTGRDSHYVGDRIDGTGDDCTTQAHVGPGSYEPRRTNAGATNAIARSVEAAAITPSASVTSESYRPESADLW